MSIATEITRLQSAKSSLKTAIELKGVTVPSSALISDYADYVAEISGGSVPQLYAPTISLAGNILTATDDSNGLFGDYYVLCAYVNNAWSAWDTEDKTSNTYVFDLMSVPSFPYANVNLAVKMVGLHFDSSNVSNQVTYITPGYVIGQDGKSVTFIVDYTSSANVWTPGGNNCKLNYEVGGE